MKRVIDNPYELLLHYSDAVTLSANDFFFYSTAMCVELDSRDYKWVIPIVKKYKSDGINAVTAFIMQLEPLPDYINENYEKAYKELEELNPKVHSREYN